MVFHDTRPQQTGSHYRTWIARGGNFAVCVSEVEPGAIIERSGEPEESMLILPPDGVSASIEANGERIEAESDSLTILPPGSNRIAVRTRGLIARIVSKASTDLIALAPNNATYAGGAPELAPPDLWPDPYDGFRIRHYKLAGYADPGGERMQPRIFRSTNMLVNIFVHYRTRRDTTALSPHWHDDFEQASLTLNGTWIHHIRHNWGSDIGKWWPDDHSETPSPSIIIIPARAIHTSCDIGPDGPESSLYDIFCPPRLDFASKKGFVINESEYPLPETSGAREVKTGGTLLSWQKSG
jgi:hypothetical protein